MKLTFLSIESDTMLLYNFTVMAVRLGKLPEACGTWFPHISISLTEQKEYYQNLLEKHSFTSYIQSTDELHGTGPSVQQTMALTRVCLKYWISRSPDEFIRTTTLLSKFVK